MVDTHCHLSICEPPDEELVAAADAAGVTRMLTVGVDEAGSRGGDRGGGALRLGVGVRRAPPERRRRLR